MTGSVETGKKTIGMWGRVEAKLELQNYNENKTRLKHTKHRTWKKKASQYQEFHVYAGSAQNDVKAPSQLITSVKTNCLHRFITLTQQPVQKSDLPVQSTHKYNMENPPKSLKLCTPYQKVGQPIQVQAVQPKPTDPIMPVLRIVTARNNNSK